MTMIVVLENFKTMHALQHSGVYIFVIFLNLLKRALPLFRSCRCHFKIVDCQLSTTHYTYIYM